MAKHSKQFSTLLVSLPLKPCYEDHVTCSCPMEDWTGNAGCTFCRLLVAQSRKRMPCWHLGHGADRAEKWQQHKDQQLEGILRETLRVGGEFCHSDYEVFGDVAIFTWMHKPTGTRWGWASFFHYTSELAFGNITHPSKEAAEIWPSLRTEGPNANAWWGKGIYTVPLPPDQWESREQLLDNNFRDMMQRDRDSDDPQKGPAYVDREYPKRAAFCVPIPIDPVNAFDVSIRATPEMEAAGKEPGRNLGNKLLNEPDKPPAVVWCSECLVKMVPNMHADSCPKSCANVCASHLQTWTPSRGSLSHYDCVASIRRRCLWLRNWWNFTSQHMVLRAIMLSQVAKRWVAFCMTWATCRKLKGWSENSWIPKWRLLVLITETRYWLWKIWPSIVQQCRVV